MIRKVFAVLPLAAALVWFAAAPARAQVGTGAVKGTVADATGASVPGTKVELKNTGTNQAWTHTTSADGAYAFPDVPAGEYQLTANASGFAEFRGSLTLRATQTASIPVTLSPSTLATAIEVRDVTPVIVTTMSAISDVKEFSRISTLPLSNRNFLSILNFSPGVVANGFAGQGNGYTRVNGIRGGSLEYMVDGMSASERYTNELQRTPQPVDAIQEIQVTTTNATAEYSRPGTVEVVTKSGTNQFHGTLFELHQNNALRGRDFHSKSVNFLIRNEFGGNLGGPVWIPKIYKGSNRTFFFADVEGIVQHSNASQKYVVPMPNWKKGDFSDYRDSQNALIGVYDPLTTRRDAATGAYTRTPFAGNALPSSRLNPAAQKILGFVPDPNVNTPYWKEQNWQRPAAGAIDNKALYTFKVDQMISAHRLAVRYNHTDRDQLAPKYFLNDNVTQQGGKNVSLSFTSMIRPTVLNEFRAGLQRFHSYRGPVHINPPITEQVGLPTYQGTIAWPGVYFGDSWTPNGYFEGIDRDNPQDAPMLGTQWSDNLTWSRGAHEFRFGFLLATNAVNTFETGQPGGDYNFSGLFTALQDPAAVAKGTTDQRVTNTGAALADMLLGHVDDAALNQYPTFYTRQKQYSFYARDNWRVARGVTLNIGLRYEYWTPFSDKRDQASNLKLDAAGGPVVVYPGAAPITKQGFPQHVVDAFVKQGLKFVSAAEAGFPSALWEMQKNNFAPRAGVAWQLNDKTVVRTAYGIFYWAMPLIQYHQNTRKNKPFSYSFDSLTDPDNNETAELVFPAGGSGLANQAADARTLGKRFITPEALSISKGSGWGFLPWNSNYKTQTAHEWNFTVERALPAKFGSRVSYIGTHGANLEVFDQINAQKPRKLAPGATPAQRRAYPDFAASSTSAMDLLDWGGYSNSNQLQTEVHRNFASGTVFQAFYTYQKTLTNSEGGNSTFSGLEMPGAALTGNASVDERLRMIYSNDTYLPRHNFSINGVYELPFGKGKKLLPGAGGLVNRLVTGWQVSGFYYWRSGMFFAPYFAVGASNTILMPDKTPVIPKDQRQAERWFDGSVWRADLNQPYNGEVFARRADSLDNDLRNNIPRTFMTGPGFYNVDCTFLKTTPINERVRLRLDAQVFNLLNHKNFAVPNTSGVVTSGVGNPRLVQLQAKVEF